MDTRLYPEVTYKFTFVRSSVRSFIHPFLTLVFQNWLIRFFCFVTQSPGSISAQSWWSPIFRRKKTELPQIGEKRVQNYSQMQGERPVEDIENSNKFHLRGNIYVHFFVNTITDIIYWNFHIFYRKVCRKYKNQPLFLPLSPLNNVGFFMLQSLLHAVIKSFVLASNVQTRKNNSLLYL